MPTVPATHPTTVRCIGLSVSEGQKGCRLRPQVLPNQSTKHICLYAQTHTQIKTLTRKINHARAQICHPCTRRTLHPAGSQIQTAACFAPTARLSYPLAPVHRRQRGGGGGEQVLLVILDRLMRHFIHHSGTYLVLYSSSTCGRQCRQFCREAARGICLLATIRLSREKTTPQFTLQSPHPKSRC